MVSEMSLIMRLSVAIFIAVCLLPSEVAGVEFACQTCPVNPLQSPGKCNLSSTEQNCSRRCFALTAELTNGTSVGMRGCASSSTGDCSTTTCNDINGTLSGPVYFGRCVAECCTSSGCNENLFPTLIVPSSTVQMVVNSTAVPTTPPRHPRTTVHSAGIKMEALLYLLIFPLVILVIMR